MEETLLKDPIRRPIGKGRNSKAHINISAPDGFGITRFEINNNKLGLSLRDVLAEEFIMDRAYLSGNGYEELARKWDIERKEEDARLGINDSTSFREMMQIYASDRSEKEEDELMEGAGKIVDKFRLALVNYLSVDNPILSFTYSHFWLQKLDESVRKRIFDERFGISYSDWIESGGKNQEKNIEYCRKMQIPLDDQIGNLVTPYGLMGELKKGSNQLILDVIRDGKLIEYGFGQKLF